MQAAVGTEQLKKLSKFVEIRKKNFNTIYNKLESYKEYLLLPEIERNADPSWFGFPIIVKPNSGFTKMK